MKQTITDTLQDWLFLFLFGLGIKMLPTEFFGGLFLALAASMVARNMMAEKDEREVWLVLFSAGVLATFTAMLLSWLRSPQMAYVPPEFPIQIAMAVSGFFSRFAIRFALRIMGRVETKADVVGDRLIDRVLPGKEGDTE
jgi:uncharacterized protein involved in response to NO